MSRNGPRDGKSRGALSDDDKRVILEMRIQGNGYKNIGKKLGKPWQTVRDYVYTIERVPGERAKPRSRKGNAKPKPTSPQVSQEIVTSEPPAKLPDPRNQIGTFIPVQESLPEGPEYRKDLERMRKAVIGLFSLMVQNEDHKNAQAYASVYFRSILAETGIIKLQQNNLIINQADLERVRGEIMAEIRPIIERETADKIWSHIRGRVCEKCLERIMEEMT